MKNRRAHVLSGNKGSQRPQHVIFFDTETRAIPISDSENKHVLKLGWACYYRPKELGNNRTEAWRFFDTCEAFWGFVQHHCKSNRKLYLVAHNVAFDLRIVEGFSYFKDNGWKEDFCYDKGLTTIIRFTRDKQTIEVISTTNLFAMSLKDLALMLGMKKGEVNFKTATRQVLSEYCRQDVEIILEAWKVWIRFLDDHDLGMFRCTISSQAFTAYRHRFMLVPISIHSNMNVCRLEREAYRGGRTECFRVGTFPEAMYYYLDVNGMYAYQMETQKYPTKLCGSRQTLPVRSLQNKLRNFAVVARVVLKTEQAAFVSKHDKRNVYPVGVFETVLTTPDLKYAIQNNMVREVKDVVWYKQDYIFKNYVYYFTRLKERYEREGNTAFRGIAKLYVNALYGKFGQTDEKASKPKVLHQKPPLLERLGRLMLNVVGKDVNKNIVIDMGDINHDTGIWTRPTDWPEGRTRKKIPEETFNSFPSIAAHVTAYARHYLWQLILSAGRKNVFYCDTDSLIVNESGLANLNHLLHETKAGYLKIEKQGTHLVIHAPKDYEIADRVRLKGIRKNADEVSVGVFKQEQFLGLAGARRRGENDLVTIKKVTKRLRREIKMGIVGDDGWITPFRFPLK